MASAMVIPNIQAHSPSSFNLITSDVGNSGAIAYDAYISGPAIVNQPLTVTDNGTEFDTLNFGFYIPDTIAIQIWFDMVYYQNSSQTSIGHSIRRDNVIFPMAMDDAPSITTITSVNYVSPTGAGANSTFSFTSEITLSFTEIGIHCKFRVLSCQCTNSASSANITLTGSRAIVSCS